MRLIFLRVYNRVLSLRQECTFLLKNNYSKNWSSAMKFYIIWYVHSSFFEYFPMSKILQKMYPFSRILVRIVSISSIKPISIRVFSERTDSKPCTSRLKWVVCPKLRQYGLQSEKWIDFVKYFAHRVAELNSTCLFWFEGRL